MDRSLLIVGASARAAAQSAAAAGYVVAAVDQFVDVDLRAAAVHVRRCERFPYDVLRLERDLPSFDWLYVGGLENYPALVERLAARRRLLGNDGPTLRRVRDVRRLAAWAHSAGLDVPEVADGAASIELADGWLWKRKRSAAGLGVVAANSAAAGGDAFRRGCGYLQRFVPGVPCGGLFVGDGRAARLIGTARHLSVPAAAGSAPFRYGGSILTPTDEVGGADAWKRIGQLLVEEFSLRGLFGVDAVVGDDGRLWLLEVNPRPTASVELFERWSGESLIARHIEVCRKGYAVDHRTARDVTNARSTPPPLGKQIVYSDRKDRMTPRVVDHWLARRDAAGRPEVADISPAGTLIDRDQPLATVFACGPTVEETAAALHIASRRLHDEFHNKGF